MTSKFVASLVERLSSTPGTILLPEGDDPRCVEAAYLCISRSIAKKVALLGTPNVIEALVKGSQHSKSLGSFKKSGSLIIVDSSDELLLQNTYNHLKEVILKKGKDPAQADLENKSRLTNHQAAYLLSKGDYEACVAGCVYTTADVIRAGLAGVGLKKGLKTVSSSFLMNRDDDAKTYIYTDCGVVIEPTAEQLVDITAASIDTYRALNPGSEPVVAFLSFSTKGSAKHPLQDKMHKATQLFKESFPSVECEGELQFDAAFDEAIGAKKAPGSKVPGRANVFVFPDLNSGNIAYKITQRLAGFEAFGPILQGLAQPYSDLSRGASSEDIFASCAISILRARV